MKKILVALLLGVSVTSFAAVVPTEKVIVKKPSVIRTDMTKVKMEVKKPAVDNSVDEESIKEMQRYQGVITMDNMEALDNLSRAIQNNPDAVLHSTFGVEDVTPANQRELMTGKAVEKYAEQAKSDDPVQKFSNVRVPDLTGSYADFRESRDELERLHKQALAQIEQIGQQRLGQKQAPIDRKLTPDDVRAMGIDTKQLPENWEAMLEETNRKVEELKKQAAAKNTQQTVPTAAATTTVPLGKK